MSVLADADRQAETAWARISYIWCDVSRAVVSGVPDRMVLARQTGGKDRGQHEANINTPSLLISLIELSQMFMSVHYYQRELTVLWEVMCSGEGCSPSCQYYDDPSCQADLQRHPGSGGATSSGSRSGTSPSWWRPRRVRRR